MRKNFIKQGKLFSLLFLIGSTGVQAVNSQYTNDSSAQQQKSPSSSTSQKATNQDTGFYISADYIYWKAGQDLKPVVEPAYYD